MAAAGGAGLSVDPRFAKRRFDGLDISEIIQQIGLKILVYARLPKTSFDLTLGRCERFKRYHRDVIGDISADFAGYALSNPLSPPILRSGVRQHSGGAPVG